MKRLKKGPEINLSKLKSGDVKVPPAISGLYKELKSQHLLPIVVILVLGLIAVPVLMGGSSEQPKPVVKQPVIGGQPTKQTALTVSRWTPGLLDYKKTLRGVKPLDPFASKAIGGESSEGGSEESAATTSEAQLETPSVGGGGGEESPPVESPAVTPPETSPSPQEGGNEGGNAGSEKEEPASVTIDVEVTAVHEDGGVDKSPERRNLPQLTKLPSEAIPALTYVGPSADGTKALMAVSSEVTAMIGESNCVVPAKPCSLLALRIGYPETIVYGPNGLTYRLEVSRVGEHSLTGKTAKDRSKKGSQGNDGSPAPRKENALIGIGGGHRILAASPAP